MQTTFAAKEDAMNLADPKLWDQISQFGVLSTIAGLWLTTKKNKWGFVVTLLGEPFWFITSYLNHQWAVFLVTCIYTAILVSGIRRWFREDEIAKHEALVT